MAKILQVCNSDFSLSKFLTPLVCRLAAEGHEVECVCEGPKIHPDILALGITIHPFSFPRTSSPWGFVQGIHRMRRLIRSGRYDCVNSHNRNASIIGRLAAWLEHVPLNLYTAHGFYFHDDQKRIAREATIWLERALAGVTDYTLSQSMEDVSLMVERGMIDPHRIEYVGNGIDTAVFSPGRDRRRLERQFGLRPDRFRICATGRLVKGKGFTDLLEAFAELHRSEAATELLIIGGNIGQDIQPFQRQFLGRVAELGLQDSVLVTGITPQVEEYLAVSDLFVLPSYREGLPRSLIEAMSMQLPVVTTNIRGGREMIRDGFNGFLYEPHDIGGLASLLARLHCSRDLGERAAKNGRDTAVAKYDQAGYVNRQVWAINRLLQGGAGASPRLNA